VALASQLCICVFFSSRRRHTRFSRDWSSDVCSSDLQEGETVLVHAASGGVGLLAVQLAKIFGAGKVLATASTQEKLQLAEKMGADKLINYSEATWDQEVQQYTNGTGVDVALEMVCGSIFHQTRKCLADFGRLVIYGVAS